MDITLIYTLFIAIIVCFLIKYIYEFYSKVQKYPKGPFPLPFFGNLLLFILKRNQNPSLTIHEIGNNYNELFTFWFGSVPMIIVFDLNLGKQVFNKVEFSGRPHTSFESMFNSEGITTFLWQPYNSETVTLRKISIESIRQIINGNKFFSTINEATVDIVDKIKQCENNKKFEPRDYIGPLFVRIFGEFSFGKKYEFDDMELKFIKDGLHTFEKESAKLLLTDYFPVMKFFLKPNNNVIQVMNELSKIYKLNFQTQQLRYENGKHDNFCEALLTARNKLLEEEKDCSKYTSDSNLVGVLYLFFVAGSDTTMNTLDWMILIISYYHDIQTKLRNEINEKIGDKAADLSDKQHLHYLNAFICETLRLKNVAPMGGSHTAMTNTKIGEYSIPKDTILWVYQYTILNNPKYWSEPEKFMPERFLDSNKMFVSKRFPAFIPFGTGKRVCVGEKMANDMLFILLSRLLQLTKDYRFELAAKQTVDLNPTNFGFMFQLKPYKIYLTPI